MTVTVTGNASTRSVGTEASGRSEPKSPTPMGGASVSEVLADPPYAYRLGDILGMALRGEITPAEAQAMADARQASNPTAEGK